MKEEEVFAEAISFKTRRERADFVAKACAGDAALCQQVFLLLDAHDSADSLLDDPSVLLGKTVAQLCRIERPGMKIGHYKLLKEIGEGGFGVVYAAEQLEPVARQVALKVIKPGMDTREVISRFQAEEQTLALMNHPNIARVFDAGVTESGRPYFVMELVKGIPITEYCDRNTLPIPERLELFISVCRAVHHAHQKGIIHRDIKPSNVLVTVVDGTPMVKVIDFGVAKAMNADIGERTPLFTDRSHMIGTPLYMSPEQAERGGLDVDTRSDVYSLGVLLYELLTGTTPIEKHRLDEIGYEEVRRIIRDQDPPKPSTRISTLRNTVNSSGSETKVDSNRLLTLVRGELDWIVVKALQKDRTRRYETGRELAADVERHLKNEPVEACPPSTSYQLRKMYHANKVGFVAAQVIAVTLLAATAFSLVQAAARSRESHHARKAQEQTEAALELANESEKELLRYMEKLAYTYLTHNRYREAERLYRKVLHVRSKRSGKNSDGAVKITPCLALALAGQNQFKEAIESYEKALADESRRLGTDHPKVDRIRESLAETCLRQVCAINYSLDVTPGELRKAENHARRAVELSPSYSSWWCLAWTQCLLGDTGSARRNLQKSMSDLPKTAYYYPFHSLLFALLEGQAGHDRVARDWFWVSCEVLGAFPHPNRKCPFSPMPEKGMPYTLAVRAAAAIGVSERWPPDDWTPTKNIEAYTRLIEKYPGYAFLYFHRSFCHARLGGWPEAFKDAERSVELDPENCAFWYRLLVLTQYLGNADEYVALCHDVIDRFSRYNLDTRADLVRYCCLAPVPLLLRDRLYNLAKNVREERSYLDSDLALGMAAYRCGRWKESLEVLPRYRLDDRKGAMAVITAAMASKKLGEDQKAEKLLEKARRSAHFFEPQSVVNAQWYVESAHQWCITQILLKEAETLID